MTIRGDDFADVAGAINPDTKSPAEAATDAVPPEVVRCPSCATDLPVGRADEVGELACPACGVRVPVVPLID